MHTFIRQATGDDLDRLAEIEEAADDLYLPRFGRPGWGSAPAGRARAQEPGFILVASESEGGPAVGFAHVLEVEGHAHLEQVSVSPAHARRGHGTALVEAALDKAAERDFEVLGLRTYADVPWNAPFYASLGFVESPMPDDDFHRGLLLAEDRVGLPAHGRRVYMQCPLAAGMELDAEAFEALVIEELDRLPDEMVEGLENVVFVVEDEPDDGSDLFGIYEGFALTERGQYGMGELPDRIVVYRHAHLAACADEAELRAEVHTTLVHEIAHFYGIDDEQLHELGWA